MESLCTPKESQRGGGRKYRSTKDQVVFSTSAAVVSPFQQQAFDAPLYTESQRTFIVWSCSMIHTATRVLSAFRSIHDSSPPEKVSASFWVTFRCLLSVFFFLFFIPIASGRRTNSILLMLLGRCFLLDFLP